MLNIFVNFCYLASIPLDKLKKTQTVASVRSRHKSAFSKKIQFAFSFKKLQSKEIVRFLHTICKPFMFLIFPGDGQVGIQGPRHVSPLPPLDWTYSCRHRRVGWSPLQRADLLEVKVQAIFFTSIF